MNEPATSALIMQVVLMVRYKTYNLEVLGNGIPSKTGYHVAAESEGRGYAGSADWRNRL